MGRCGQERTVRTLKALDALGSGARVPWSPRVLTRCCLQVFPVALRLLVTLVQMLRYRLFPSRVRVSHSLSGRTCRRPSTRRPSHPAGPPVWWHAGQGRVF